MEFSVKHQAISESMTLAISARAKSMKAVGLDVISFGAGEPDFNTPENIIEAAKEALDNGITNYTAASGMAELKKSIVDKLKNDNNLDYELDQIIVSNGAKHSLYNTFQALLNPGDEVIIPSPYWVSYPELVKMAGAVPVFVKCSEENDFLISIEDLKAAQSKKTKAIILNSPSNPTGTTYGIKQLKEIADFAVSNNLFVISDEIYEKIIYDDNEHISIASLGDDIKELTVVINGVSKAFAMTGWRIGYAAGPKKLVSIMSSIQSHATSNPNSIAQYATISALNTECTAKSVKKMHKEFDKRRIYMYEKINSITGISCIKPKGAFYIMVNINKLFKKKYEGKKISGSLEFAKLLLADKYLAVIPGIAFDADNYIRLSYANSMENIKEGLDRLENFIKKLD
ncbi:pyridoxal phosphate-dependent aminotransferase [Natronospora cellulosivora (SeqCode)]